VAVDLGKGFTQAVFTVYSLNIHDCWTQSSAFPQILETKELTSKGQVVSNTSKVQAFVFKFESNDDMLISPFKIEIATEKTLFIVLNIHFINEVTRSSLIALNGEVLDFSFYKNAATEKALEYMTTGKEFIESIKKGEYKHQSLNIRLFMTAPIIVIPEDIFRPEKACLVVDTGSISLQSYLVGYTQGVDYKILSSPKSLYDRY
jgi:Repeating coiled region of VPS13